MTFAFFSDMMAEFDPEYPFNFATGAVKPLISGDSANFGGKREIVKAFRPDLCGLVSRWNLSRVLEMSAAMRNG